MTREGAARVLTELADDFEKHELSENGWLETTYIPAHRMGVAALRGPDPDTGCPECSWIDPALSDRNYCKNCGRRLRIDTPPGNDSVRASTGFQRDGGDKTERRCNQCVHCGQEMPEGDQVCGYCRRQHGY